MTTLHEAVAKLDVQAVAIARLQHSDVHIDHRRSQPQRQRRVRGCNGLGRGAEGPG